MSKSLGNFLNLTFGFLIIFIFFACDRIINVLSYHAWTVGLRRVTAAKRRTNPLPYPFAFRFQDQYRQSVETPESRSKQANDCVRMRLSLSSSSNSHTGTAALIEESKQSDVSLTHVQSIASCYDIHIHTKQQQEVETGGDSFPLFEVEETWELFFQQHGTTTGYQSSQKYLNTADIVCSGKVSFAPSSSSTNNIENKKNVSICVQCKAAHNDNDKMTTFAELCPFLVLNRLVNLVPNSGRWEKCNMNVEYVDWKDRDDGDNNIRRIDVEPSLVISSTNSLYHSFLGMKDGEEKKIEMVDMVNTDGEALLSLPRQLVHQHNILHRGSGMLVMKLQEPPKTKTDALAFIRDNPPSYWKDKIQLYCHRRTKTKRIFPSMYDIFVGGVSGADESDRITAGRELAEELGLQRALEAATSKSKTATDVDSPLEGPIFRCTVQTSHNRCVVSVFLFTYDDELDRISWQEEEVDWGDFVSYEDVEASAMLSIQRLQDSGKWPGVPCQFTNLDEARKFLDQRAHSEMKDWDYVPDGLLVWQAWEEWLKNEARI